MCSIVLQGEGVTDSSVWIVKSHFPERIGFVRFQANRVVVLVRNPFDALLSYFHMGMTNTHNRSLSTEVFICLYVLTIYNFVVRPHAICCNAPTVGF